MSPRTALFLSGLALLGAIIGAYLGAVRIGLVTTLIVAATLVVSPLSPTEQWLPSLPGDRLLVWLAMTIAAVAVVLYIRFEPPQTITLAPHHLLGIGFSLLGLMATILVWTAGSHRYGLLSQVWRYTGMQGLLLVAVISFAASAALIRRSYRVAANGRSLLPVAVFLTCSIPFILLCVIIAVRLFQNAG